MSYYSIVGAHCYVSTGREAAKAISNITNASPPVVTATSHGYANNDEVLLRVDWEDFNYAIFRVSSVATNSYELTGYDSSDTDFYPAGSDTGNGYEITAWTEIGQVLGITSSGGDAKFEDLEPYDKRNGIRIPTGFSPASLDFTLGYDSALTAQVSMLTASRVLAKKAFKFVLPGPAYAYCYGTVSASALPTFDRILKRKVSISIDGLFTSFV